MNISTLVSKKNSNSPLTEAMAISNYKPNQQLPPPAPKRPAETTPPSNSNNGAFPQSESQPPKTLYEKLLITRNLQSRVESLCDIPTWHIGKIPGIPVGFSWLRRKYISKAKVHRPTQAGIAVAKGNYGSPSIVISGNYMENKDFGDSFVYVGTGEAKDNNRSCEALALTMGEPFDTINGRVAKDYKNSRPVRVCRKYTTNIGAPNSKQNVNNNTNNTTTTTNNNNNSNNEKRPSPATPGDNESSTMTTTNKAMFCPKIGYRYDGLYKLKRYWKQVGSEGFEIWHYEFIRDDDEPAPWSPEGQRRIHELGLTMYYEQENPLDVEARNRMLTDYKKSITPVTFKSGQKKYGNYSNTGSSTKNSSSTTSVISKLRNKSLSPTSPKYTPGVRWLVGWKNEELAELMRLDRQNARLWTQIQEKYLNKEKYQLYPTIKKYFKCKMCSQRVVQRPVTLTCQHTFCESCLSDFIDKMPPEHHKQHLNCVVCKTSFAKQPARRFNPQTGRTEFFINLPLVNILRTVYPDYGAGDKRLEMPEKTPLPQMAKRTGKFSVGSSGKDGESGGGSGRIKTVMGYQMPLRSPTPSTSSLPSPGKRNLAKVLDNAKRGRYL